MLWLKLRRANVLSSACRKLSLSILICARYVLFVRVDLIILLSPLLWERRVVSWLFGIPQFLVALWLRYNALAQLYLSSLCTILKPGLWCLSMARAKGLNGMSLFS